MHVLHYTMTASTGSEEHLRRALERLAKNIREAPGTVGVQLFEDAQKSGEFIFIEQWESADAYKAGAKALPKEALAQVMSYLGAAPSRLNLISI